MSDCDATAISGSNVSLWQDDDEGGGREQLVRGAVIVAGGQAHVSIWNRWDLNGRGSFNDDDTQMCGVLCDAPPMGLDV